MYADDDYFIYLLFIYLLTPPTSGENKIVPSVLSAD